MRKAQTCAKTNSTHKCPNIIQQITICTCNRPIMLLQAYHLTWSKVIFMFYTSASQRKSLNFWQEPSCVSACDLLGDFCKHCGLQANVTIFGTTQRCRLSGRSQDNHWGVWGRIRTPVPTNPLTNTNSSCDSRVWCVCLCVQRHLIVCSF